MSRALSNPAIAAGRRSSSSSIATTALYLEHTTRPLYALALLLPAIAVYEIGTYLFATLSSRPEERIIAFDLLRQLFGWIGLHSRFLPAMTCISVLVFWHVSRRDPLEIRGKFLRKMLVEAGALAIPLVVAGMLFVHAPALAAGSGSQNLIASFGAGIYEEFLFRLVAFALFSSILHDVLHWKSRACDLLIITLSAALFSLYHYLGSETFEWPSFVFRTIAGIYFGGLMVYRGFGVTAATHISYDIVVACLRLLAA